MPISLTEQLRCVRREIRMREQVYPNLVARGQMTQAQADSEIARMEAVATTLARLVVAECGLAQPLLPGVTR